jgi:hypothetical protein
MSVLRWEARMEKMEGECRVERAQVESADWRGGGIGWLRKVGG